MNKKSKSTLEKLEKILRVRNYSEQTIKTYTSYCSKFLSNYNVDIYHIPVKDVKAYLEEYKYTSVSQQNQIINSIKFLYKNIVGSELKTLKIIRPKKEKKLPRVIDKDFLLQKISEIENLKHKLLIALPFSVGLRVSEVINLKIRDIDSKRMVIHIKNAKGRKDRIVPLTEAILLLMRKYFRKHRPIEFLFNGQTKLKYTSSSCNKVVKKYLGNSYHYHLLRHSAATSIHESGTDIATISKLLGHSNVSTSMIYTHISNNALKNIATPI